jgi:hypothetical protein
MEVNGKMNKKLISILVACLIADALVLGRIFFVIQPQEPSLTIVTKFEIHLLVQQFRDGKLISQTYHAMTVVNNGKDWVEQQLFNPNASQKALYIACSNASDSVSTTWTAIPNEITDGGLARDDGAYVSTGVGTANVSITFSVTATRSTKLYGIYYFSGTSATLIAAEQQGVGSQKNLVSGDSLAITAQWSHS